MIPTPVRRIPELDKLFKEIHSQWPVDEERSATRVDQLQEPAVRQR